MSNPTSLQSSSLAETFEVPHALPEEGDNLQQQGTVDSMRSRHLQRASGNPQSQDDSSALSQRVLTPLREGDNSLVNSRNPNSAAPSKEYTQLKEKIDAWKEASDMGAKLKENVETYILEYIKNPCDTMDFSNYSDLESLPDVFDHSAFVNLKTLNLSDTQITYLPDSIGNLASLKKLDLSETWVGSLPDSFGNLSCLEELDLNNTPTRFLSDSIGDLHSLIELDLRDTQITFLPDSICNLSSLEWLFLDRTPLASLPSAITNLPNDCTIYLTISRFSERVRTNLEEQTNQPDYSGPTFEYDNAEEENSTSLSNTPLESLQAVFTAAEQNGTVKTLLDALTDSRLDKEKDDLHSWLHRLHETADAQSEGRTQFFNEILEILNLASKDSGFKGVFYRVLDDASRTCGDRIALSVLHMGIQNKLASVNTSKPMDVVKFLIKGVFVMDLLEKTARNIITTLPFVDPLEVYLGLPMKLKDEYDLPINTSNMLYYDCSALKDSHLTQTRDIVDEALKDENKVLKFLIEQPKWLESLEKLFSKEIEAIKETKSTSLNNISDDLSAADGAVIEKETEEQYDIDLMKLTKTAMHTRRRLPVLTA
ncbi:hypothetical protein COB11_05085 [Candidatus Aerophobetes bacterium]|uniref:NEL domain-containing protein n=1 Tax=Aerophobetes bacterium TaxID=2030807 RepID=A0A2A4YFW3_UNCAE|nr:MAG: hypothetical protein COB11_05085 [Candidatus Aerophobetes bacterium]